MSDGAIPNDRITMFVCVLPFNRERMVIQMESTYTHAVSIPLPNPSESYDLMRAVFGSDNLEGTKKETAVEALLRYMSERDVGNNQLAYMTGIDKGVISRYLNNKRVISKEHLCLICIALRLMTCQQKHLFDILKEPMPCMLGIPDIAEYIIKHHMDGCFYDENMTVIHCNDQLIEFNVMPITGMFSTAILRSLRGMTYCSAAVLVHIGLSLEKTVKLHLTVWGSSCLWNM